VDDDDVLGEVRFRAPDRHSSHALPAVEFLLRTVGVLPRDVEGYAVTVGPGPFTGLRVGISTVQGLAMAGGRLVLPMSGLDVLAARMRGEGEVLVPMIDAGRGQVYAARYDKDARLVEGPFLASPAELLETLPEGAVFLGDGALAYQSLLRTKGYLPSRRSLFLAGTLARLAVSSFGEAKEPSEIRPLYLRGADIRGTVAPPGG